MSQWKRHHDAVFVDRDFDQRPFLHGEWSVLCMAAPAYFLETPPILATDKQKAHLKLYGGLEQAIASMGDTELVGALQGGPHLNPSMFHSDQVTGASVFQMRQQAVDGFDLNVFSRSESWGLVVSWEEELALIGGSQAFMASLDRAVGGREAIRANFKDASAYLLELGNSQRALVARLTTLFD